MCALTSDKNVVYVGQFLNELFKWGDGNDQMPNMSKN